MMMNIQTLTVTVFENDIVQIENYATRLLLYSWTLPPTRSHLSYIQWVYMGYFYSLLSPSLDTKRFQQTIYDFQFSWKEEIGIANKLTKRKLISEIYAFNLRALACHHNLNLELDICLKIKLCS